MVPTEHGTFDHSIVADDTPLPPPASTEEEDEALFANDAWVEPPIRKPHPNPKPNPHPQKNHPSPQS